MKKKIIGCITLGLLACTISTTAFAGTWQQEKWGDWEYIKDDGSYARNEWIYDGGSWYFIHNTTSMASDEIVSDNENDTSINRNNYFVDTSGKMVKGGFFDKDSYDRVFVDKDGLLVRGLFMVDGVLYNAGGGLIDKNFTSSSAELLIYKSTGGEVINCTIDKGKVSDTDGKPFTADSKLYKSIKYLPEYDSKGNLIGTIQNPNGYRID